MTVSVHLKAQSQQIDYIDVINAYTKDGLYCIYTKDELVYKYPIIDIFRIIESYKKTI